MGKLTGYMIILVGLVILILNVFAKKIPQLAELNITPLYSIIIIIVAAAVIFLGILFLKKGSREKLKEVPIMHGEDVVGYRIIKSKK